MSSFLLASQNKALAAELFSYKRKLGDARKELELMRAKSHEMESLVSLIQRAWSQLDIDASMLLDVLGDAENLSLTQTNSDMLNELLRAGQDMFQQDAVEVANSTQLCNVDHWSTESEIENERLRAIQRCSNEGNVDSSVDGRYFHDLARVNQTISNHTQFTLSLLERICVGISESGIFENIPRVISAMSDHKAWQSERLLLIDRIAKISAECVNTNAKLTISEKQRLKCEKKLHSQTVELDTCKAKLRSKESLKAGSTEVDSSVPEIMAEADQEMLNRVLLLERQLVESETARAKVEMSLTERVSRPFAQTEAQVADVRRAMEDLRAQCKQRVATLFAEVAKMLMFRLSAISNIFCVQVNSLQDKVASFELGIQRMETESEARCDLVVAEAKEAIKVAVDCKDKALADLASVRAELSLALHYKAQVELSEILSLG